VAAPDAGLAARVGARLGARLMREAELPIVLGLSGGGDSLALLDIAADWARLHGRRLLAVTVDHGLNPASRDWSRFCAEACAKRGVGWIERRWDGDKPAIGLTAAARTARHRLIAEAARAVGAKVVLLAHTADDVLESDWMRSRPVEAGGSTLGRLREWSPSPVWPEGRGLMLFRPLLEERREALRGVLKDGGEGWIEDPANADVRFGRSRARQALAAGKAAGEGARGYDTPHPPVDLGVRPLPLSLGEGFGVRREVGATALAAALLSASGASAPPRRDRLERLIARLRSGENFNATLAGARIEARDETVLIGREPGEFRRRAPDGVLLTPGQATVWDGRYEIVIAEAGWTVTAAAGRLNRLSDADRAVVAGVRPWARGALPVLIRDDGAGPVLAWRKAEVRALSPRRLALFLGAAFPGAGDETTQEAGLCRTIHGETPPADLFSHKDHHRGLG
jgi:tRNA(Ile)-lysidine synthase